VANNVIALDGPAGSGKSTVARILAEKLNYIHADSGAIYRTVTLALMEKLGGQASSEKFGEILVKNDLDFKTLKCQVLLVDHIQSNQINGIDVGSRIRTPEVTERIRYIADNPKYRDSVNELLRGFADKTNLVVDGRDIGTVVFPMATCKFYLDASVEVRAKRRRLEYGSQNIELDQTALELDIKKRDEQDKSRTFGALKQAPDAILIDTSELDINGVVVRILSCMQVQF